MTPVISRETLEALRVQVEEGYAVHGTLHRLLEEWHRVDDAGIPGAGQRFASVPLALGSSDDVLLRHVIHLDQIGLAFAKEEARLYFDGPGRRAAASPGAALDRAVGHAVSQALAYGVDVAIWVNLDDEQIVYASGAAVDPQPDQIRDGWWRHRRVITTTLVPTGAIWVAGQGAGILRYHREADGDEPRIRLSVYERDGTVFMQASIRMGIVDRTATALHRIEITR